MFIGGAGVLYSSSNAEDWLNILNLIDSQLHDVVYINDHTRHSDCSVRYVSCKGF